MTASEVSRIGGLTVGIHLPQIGRSVRPGDVAEGATAAEELGFDDVWVSDHIVVPGGRAFPDPFTLDALTTLTWAAAVTNRVRLGSSVLILPYRQPVVLAKQVATLSSLSEGRLVLGVGAGWLESEFAAVDAPISRRGAMTSTAIDTFRRCWGPQPMVTDGSDDALNGMAMEPQPDHSIPIWVGGVSDAAMSRACERGDGWHGLFHSPDVMRGYVERLRRDRPEEQFTISLRLGWNPDVHVADTDRYRGLLEEYAQVGVQHVMFAPANAVTDPRADFLDLPFDAWLRAAQGLDEVSRA